MSDTQFTRLTWRAGARRVTRPRQRHYGGQVEANPALLAAARLHQFGSGAHATCKAIARKTGLRCTQPTIGGLGICRHHRGAANMASRGLYVRRKRRDDTPETPSR